MNMHLNRDWKTITRYLLFFLLVLCVTSGIDLIARYTDTFVPMFAEEPWQKPDGFFEVERPETHALPETLLSSSTMKLWRSWSPGDGAVKGHIRTTSFKAPQYMAIPYTGAPGDHALTYIAVTCEETGSEYRPKLSLTGDVWSLAVVQVPKAFWGKTIHVSAQSGDRISYIGIGTPFGTDNLTFSLCRWYLAVPALGILYWFFFSGLILCFSLLGPMWWPASLRFIFSVVAAMGTGMIEFSLFAFDPKLGQWISCMLLVAVVALPVFFWIRWPARLMSALQAIKPYLSLWFFFFVAVIAFVSGLQKDTGAMTINGLFAPLRWGFDNQIPGAFCEALFTGVPGKDIGWGPWLASDRPPLLAGLLLPARLGAHSLGLPVFLNYQVYTGAGIALMTAWLPVLTAVVDDQSRHECSARLILVPLLVSGFFFFNTVYLWPKLMAGILGTAGFWALYSAAKALETNRKAAWIYLATASAAAAGAVLSHAGTGIGLLVFSPVLLIFLKPGNRLMMLVNSMVLFVLAMPWVIWKLYVQPGGNALFKCAFVGDFIFNERHVPVLDTVVAVYRELGLVGWVQTKLNNLSFLFANDCVMEKVGLNGMGPFWRFSDTIDMLRIYDYYHLFFVLKFFLIGLVVVFWQIIYGKKITQVVPRFFLDVMFYGFIGVCLALFLLMPPPVVHHLPYVSIIMICLGGYALLFWVSKSVFMGVLVADCVYWLIVWVISPIVSAGGIHLFSLALFLFGGLMLMVELIKKIPCRHEPQV